VSAAALVLALAVAAAGPHGARPDPRIRTIDYDRDRVVSLVGALGRQVMIEFADGERIENVAVGDSSKWMITPNKRADLLFVKSLEARGRSNMTVVTDRHRYIFDLIAAPEASPNALYDLRFRYSQTDTPTLAVVSPPPSTPSEAPAPSPRPRNSLYSYTGAQALVPVRVYDDGEQTYLRWTPTTPIPAISSVDAQGRETLVNPTMRNGDLVIDGTAAGFVLRSGPLTLRLFNDGFAGPSLDADAPRARTAKATETPPRSCLSGPDADDRKVC
jgi:type IV secretion system protein VirB9